MKKITKYTLMLAGLLSFSSCSEDDLAPSLTETDRMNELLDMNNPIVKDLKENYQVNLLTNFNDTLDFKFGFYTTTANERWEAIKITHLPDEEVQYAIDQYNGEVLQFLSPEFKKMLPSKILLSQTTDISDCHGNPDKTLARVDEPEEGYVTVIANEYSYMCSYNKEGLEGATSQIKNTLRGHKLYHMISTVMNRHKLFEAIPQAFKDPVKDFYGMSLDSLARMEPELPVIPAYRPRYYKPEWYIGKGFAITKNSPNTRNFTTVYERTLRIESQDCYVPYYSDDFKNFVHLMCYGKESNFEKYYLKSPVFCERMRLAIETLEGWGVNIRAFNPYLEIFFK